MGGRTDSDIFVVQPVAEVMEGFFAAFGEIRDFVLLKTALFQFLAGKKIKIRRFFLVRAEKTQFAFRKGSALLDFEHIR